MMDEYPPGMAITQREIDQAVEILIDRITQLGDKRFYDLMGGRYPKRTLSRQEAGRVLATWASAMNERITQSQAEAYFDAVLIAMSRGERS
jgi:hypothetical protein